MDDNTNRSLESLPAWLQHAVEVEAQCRSVAAAGLAAELGMIDRELIRKSRAAVKAAESEAEAGSVAREETPPYGE